MRYKGYKSTKRAKQDLKVVNHGYAIMQSYTRKKNGSPRGNNDGNVPAEIAAVARWGAGSTHCDTHVEPRRHRDRQFHSTPAPGAKSLQELRSLLSAW